MKIEFDITSADDARKAADVCAALAALLGGAPPAADVVPPPPLDIPDDIESARKVLQDIARSKGVTWLRRQTAQHNVTRLSDLSDDAVHALLREAVARD